MRGAQRVVKSDKHGISDSFECLEPTLASSVAEMGVQTPTSIQRSLPEPISHGTDVIAVAPTGSGKTLAYLLPLLQRWVMADVNNKPGTLILVPTRELARQSHDVIKQLSSRLPWIKVVILHGGVSINPQLMALRGGADFVIATPGRLLDVIKHNGLDVSDMKHLVLDEADRLLDEGFVDEIESVMRYLSDAQTVLVSATFSAHLKQWSASLLKAPVFINEASSAELITHRLIEVDKVQRTELLVQLLGMQQLAQVLVFASRHGEADRLAAALSETGMPARALHGKLSQAKRSLVMNGFMSGDLGVVVATDLAARGLDVPRLPVVVNFDLPRSPQDYVHRAGRTGRAGQSGQVITLVDADSRAHMDLIKNRCKLTITHERMDGFIPLDVPAPRQLVGDENGGIKGRKPSKKDRLRAARAADDPLSV